MQRKTPKSKRNKKLINKKLILLKLPSDAQLGPLLSQSAHDLLFFSNLSNKMFYDFSLYFLIMKRYKK